MRSILDVPPQTAGRNVLVAMLNAVTRGSCRALEHSEPLPPATYVSDEFFALEVEKIFKPGWVCVGHASQAPEAGDYFTLDPFDEMLVIVRGRDSVILTLSRICTHHWAPLIEENAKLFSRPFHQWGFDLTGKLLGAPVMDKVEFRQEDCDLARFPTEVVDGFIYANLSSDAPSLLADLSEQLAKFKLDELIMAETISEYYRHIAANMPAYEAFMEKEMQQLGAKTGAARPGRLSHLEKAVWQLSEYVRAKIAQ